jgi:hypothetical protein
MTDDKATYRFKFQIERIADGHQPVQLGHDLVATIDPDDKRWIVHAEGDDSTIGTDDLLILAVLDYIASRLRPPAEG